MIYSSKHHKYTNEDPKTSTIFETLMLLPDNLFWNILRNSTRNDKSNLPEDAGQLQSYYFWPKWNPTNTNNTNYVEPDVFFRFEKIDVIVEAKYGDDSGQYYEEWEREVIAYSNEFEKDKRNVILLSVGGNPDYSEEAPINYNSVSCQILKYRWGDLLEQLLLIEKKLVSDSEKIKQQPLFRLITLIKEGFEIMGVSDYKKKTELKACENIYSFFKMIEDSYKRNIDICKFSGNSLAATAERYIFRFKVTPENKSKEEFWIGIGIWFNGSILALEMDPRWPGSSSLIKGIEKKEKKHIFNYLTEMYMDSGEYYIDATDKFYDDFSASQTYEEQLKILNSFVDEFLYLYLK